MRVALSCLMMVVASSALPRLAYADDTPTSPKRQLPDYDGRGPTDDHDGAGVWLARAVLSPFYFTSEYLLRRPLGALTVAAERGEIPRKLYDFFAFGLDHKLGFAPVALADFGFNPSIGLYGFWNDAFTPRNDLRLHYEAWPSNWLAGSITDQYRWGEQRSLRLRVVAFSRPDQVFYGIGSSSLQTSQSRFTERSFDASAALTARYWKSSRVEATVGLHKVGLTDGAYDTDPSLSSESSTGAFSIPYGFDRGYLAPYTRLLATLDTRAPNATRGSGARIELQAEEGTDVEHTPSGWIRYGATASALIDLDDHGRILTLTLAALFADPLRGGDPIPFTELVSLGGDKWMPGYFPGRLVGRSAALASIRYTWPIAPWLGGALEAVVGNVFDEHLENLKPELLRFSGAIGLTTTSDPPIELLAGFGTETFEHGGQATSLRLSLGVPRSF